MKIYRRINRVAGESDRVQVAEIGEGLKCRYYTAWGDGTSEDWAIHDLSCVWENIDEFLCSNPDFKEVTKNELQRFFEIESCDSKAERI